MVSKYYCYDKETDKYIISVKKALYQMRKLQIPTRFHMGEVAALYDNPVKQAEYLYSLIESKKKSQSSESQRTAASVQTAMSRLQVMKLRSSTTQNIIPTFYLFR